MNIKQFIPPICILTYRKLMTRNETKYKIGKYEIEIPPNYGLPGIQKNNKLYDRFLPVLAKYLSSKKLIIDIGANIGDTAISILQTCENPIICIEASDIFFPYLIKNINLLPDFDLNRITTINKFVGTGLLSGDLDHSTWGTASVQITNNPQINTHTPLDILVEDNSNVVLIKVDTDGFDFDVIKSAEKIISHSKPILYWENQISEDFQLNGFNELYNMLIKYEYRHIFIFDNFGNLITEENNFETLRNINSYVYSIDKHNCTRSIYYTDILATTEQHYLTTKAAIKEFKTDWINK